MLESIPNDPSNHGPAPVNMADLQKCETPECPYMAERLHLIGSGLHVCSQCLEDLPRCENCDGQGGTPRHWIENEEEPETGRRWHVDGCTLCETRKALALAPFTDEEAQF